MSSSDKKIEELINKINKLTDDFNKYKNTVDDIIIMNTTLVQEIANQINTKIDILCNASSNNKTSKTTNAKKPKSLTKTSFFKDKMKSDINSFINVLYTQEELDELYNNDDVKIKKTEASKKTKVIELLYSNITKKDENKHSKLKELFEEYKKNIDNSENESTNGSINEEEETKSNN